MQPFYNCLQCDALIIVHFHELPACFSSLQLQGTNVHISLAFPPDTDTPGYKLENETKVLAALSNCTALID